MRHIHKHQPERTTAMADIIPNDPRPTIQAHRKAVLATASITFLVLASGTSKLQWGGVELSGRVMWGSLFAASLYFLSSWLITLKEPPSNPGMLVQYPSQPLLATKNLLSKLTSIGPASPARSFGYYLGQFFDTALPFYAGLSCTLVSLAKLIMTIC